MKIWRAFPGELNQRQQLHGSESFLDGSFPPANKGALRSGKPAGGKARSGWWWSTARVFLWETSFTLLARARSGWRKATRATIRVPRRAPPRQKLQRVIADWGYDSDQLRLARRGNELIIPHRSPRSQPATQDGRALRHYRRCWLIERTFAWLGNYSRLVVGYNRTLTIYQGIFHIACFMIVLRRLCNCF